MKCANCGHILNEGDLFCGECGTKVVKEVQVATPAPKQEPVKEPVTDSVAQPQPSNTREEPINAQPEPAKTSMSGGIQTNELVNEGKNFFAQAFKNHDREISSNHLFTPLLTGILLAAGLLISFLVLYLKVPDEIISFGLQKSDIATKLFLFVLVYTAVSLCTTFILTKTMISSNVSFTKVMSDYTVVNIYSAIVGFIGLLFFSFKSLGFGNAIALIALLMLGYSGVYLIAKYSVIYGAKLPSFLTVVIYTIVMTLVFYLFKDTFTDLIMTIIKGALQNAVSNTVNDFTKGLFGN